MSQGTFFADKDEYEQFVSFLKAGFTPSSISKFYDNQVHQTSITYHRKKLGIAPGKINMFTLKEEEPVKKVKVPLKYLPEKMNEGKDYAGYIRAELDRKIKVLLSKSK